MVNVSILIYGTLFLGLGALLFANGILGVAVAGTITVAAIILGILGLYPVIRAIAIALWRVYLPPIKLLGGRKLQTLTMFLVGLAIGWIAPFWCVTCWFVGCGTGLCTKCFD